MRELRLLGGRYGLAETLGYGGMAEVYRGRDERLGRDVAVKVLRADLARDPTFLARFRREAQAAASLNHPSIVSVYDTGEDLAGVDGPAVPYIVMEYVEGRTLRDVLCEEGRLLPQRALEIVAEVCGALEYSHRAGIIHRDIKPGNVMLTRTGEVKVMDFGIARAIASASATVTQTAAVIGTAQYLSPEQARGEPVDARSDVYSTGCLLYELVAGAPPFTGDSPVAVAYQHVREDPVPPSAYSLDIPPAVDAVVLKALAKNPANRYQSAGEMRADLERAAAGLPVRATPVLRDETTVLGSLPIEPAAPAPGRRRRRTYGLLALAAVAVFVAALLSGFLTGTRRSVSAPELRSLTRAEATARLVGLDLRLGPVDQVFSDRPVDTVVDQRPLPGVRIRRNEVVALTVSKGVEMVTVPPVVGQSESDARATLAAARLSVADTSTEDANAAAGSVLRVTPAAGQSVPVGSAVRLVLASGEVTVPRVVGRDQNAAATLLEQAGFRVQVTGRPDASVAPNVVLTQSPPGGSTASRRATVTIVVAQPTPVPSPPPTPSPIPTAESPSPGSPATPTPTATGSPSSAPEEPSTALPLPGVPVLP